MYEASLSCSPTRKTYISEENENILPPEQTGIVDSGATHVYIAPTAPHGPLDTSTSRIRVDTANGQLEISTAKATLPIPQLAAWPLLLIFPLVHLWCLLLFSFWLYLVDQRVSWVLFTCEFHLNPQHLFVLVVGDFRFLMIHKFCGWD